MTWHFNDFGVTRVPIKRVNGECAVYQTDDVSVEDPLEISLSWPFESGLHTKTVAITMRTPGNDEPLAAGFLFTEGIISSRTDVASVQILGRNYVCVTLQGDVRFDPAVLDRHSFVSLSCGACGKQSIAAVKVARRLEISPGIPLVDPAVIHCLPDILRRSQAEFSRTGGLHASALFDSKGTLIRLQEDVGRHNALDKLIGGELLAGNIPLSDRILLVSGRVSFELVQKAAIAGVPVVAAVGAPSSLAIDLAAECGITLLGFVRDHRFNLYHDSGRIQATSPAQSASVL